MSFSGILDLAIGLTFLFAITAGLAAVITETIAQVLGLRAAFLLQGLRQLIGGEGDIELHRAQRSYQAFRDVMLVADPTHPKATQFTQSLLGSPLLRGTGMQGTVSDRHLTIRAETGSRVSGSVTRPALVAYRPASKGDGGPTKARKIDEWRLLRSLPSYIPSRLFANATLALLTPAGGVQDQLAPLRTSVDRLSDGDLRDALNAMLDTAQDDVAKFQASLESWYDDHMNRVSGWYKRYVARWTLGIAALLVVLLNINTVSIAQTLYFDADVRGAVATVAAASTDCSRDPAATSDAGDASTVAADPDAPATATAADQSLADCLNQMQDQLAAAQTAGLPIGWGAGQASAVLNDGGKLGLSLVGWLLTILALTPGARFWFDAMGKLGSLRSTGPKPESGKG